MILDICSVLVVIYSLGFLPGFGCRTISFRLPRGSKSMVIMSYYEYIHVYIVIRVSIYLFLDHNTLKVGGLL